MGGSDEASRGEDMGECTDERIPYMAMRGTCNDVSTLASHAALHVYAMHVCARLLLTRHVFTHMHQVGSWNMGAKEFSDPGHTQIKQFIPLEYDIYVVGVQECASPSFYDAVSSYLAHHGVRRCPIAPRVEGRGDGSFLKTKYTGIALYVTKPLLRHVHVLKTAACSLGMTEGSKGVSKCNCMYVV